MSCGCGKDFDTGSCVLDVLKEIEKVQNAVEDDDCCRTSCEESINEVLGETRPRRRRKDTVPIILYNKDGSPFKGFGYQRVPGPDKDCIVASFIFRVKHIDKKGCAVLELLLKDGENCGPSHLKDPTQQCPDDLESTGICITVNLHCFCHVTCLPAVRLRRD
ncbi:CotY/CotZ family spore coat protein [Oceanobacillus luteolus]|uniref:CotY/CotZ family spore coat protein n=1 Tax=Oceanobacillus luteolus TaxID=1274358 RepID=A0ABW4HVP1_9BACI|nr:CotY/CotZ family spore coat protein [Oceanobacillus luteolus]MCM3741123.1 CotY/CotZ family spore coat protein [Oceanobacillus luteolus]